MGGSFSHPPTSFTAVFESVDTVKGAQLCAPTSHLYFIDLKNAINGTGLTNTTVNTTYQPLCRGSGGGTRPPVGGLGGSPPNLGFSTNDYFSLKLSTIRPNSLKLSQKAQITAVQPANIINLVQHHSKALSPKTSRKTRVNLRVVTHCLQYIGVNHTTASHF